MRKEYNFMTIKGLVFRVDITILTIIINMVSKTQGKKSTALQE